ncbi:MAG: sigma factor-like helix-turn-helix DNA-binding protein, partial [Mycoplasmatales bacterium]
MNRLYNLYELESINYKLVEKIVESSALDAVQKNTRQEFKRFCTSDKEINAIIKELKMRRNFFDFDSVFGLIEYGVSVRILEPFKGDQINIRTYNLNTINMLKYEYGFSTVKFEKIRKAFVKYYIVGNQLNENFYDDYQKVYNYFVENKLGQTIAKTDLYIKLREIGFNKKNFQDVIEEMLFDRTIVKKGIGLELSLLPLEEEIKLAPKNELFEMRLTGLTLEEIGEKMNITRERVRQVINTYVKTLKLTQVDIYAKLFCTYRLSESEFKYMTKLSNKEYYYLCARYSRGVEDVVNLLEDKQFKYLNLDVDMFEEYKEATNEIKIKPHSRTKIVQRFVEKNMKQPMRTIDEVCVAINVFSENLKLENPIVFEKRQLYGYLTRNGNVLFSYGNKVRFYDVQKNFHQSYRKIIRVVNELKKGFYSTSYFINSHSSLFVDELKLQNEYEIHNFLRQTIEDLDIVFERTPHFSIGGISKDEFVKAEIQKFGVFEKKAFINHLYDKYGLGKNAFEIYIDSQMKQYKKNGLLVLNLDLQNESPITDVKLTELMYTKEEVKKIFENAFP